VDQIALPSEDATHSIAYVPADLRHPEPIRRGGNASDLDSARREIEEEKNEEPLQSAPGPHLDREEIGSDDQFPVTRVAVGTPVARCPPHRPVLALLTHTVPT